MAHTLSHSQFSHCPVTTSQPLMKAVILRTVSVPIFHHHNYHHSFSPASPRLSLKTDPVRLEINRSRITRSSSDSGTILSQIDTHALDDEGASVSGIGSLRLNEIGFNRRNYTGDRSRSGIPNPVEEVSFVGGACGGGGGDDESRFTDTFSGGNSDRGRISEYYQEMLKADPMNPLLLRNYGKFLHEVEGKIKKAEECYERAILASPGDGEMLSLYAKLIWQLERDEDRTKSYFDQAVQASPDNCMVLGSYAHFMWEAEDDDEEDVAAAADHNSVLVS